MWHVPFEPGTLKAISRKNGREVLTQTVHTAGRPAKIELVADRSILKADGKDISFITVKILDEDGNIVPDADNKVDFKIDGNGFIAGIDNGDENNHDPFKADYTKAFHGLALAIVQAKKKPGLVTFTVTSAGLQPASVVIVTK